MLLYARRPTAHKESDNDEQARKAEWQKEKLRAIFKNLDGPITAEIRE